jgi:choline monooxygenase
MELKLPPLERDLSLARAFSGFWYTDPDVFLAEKEKIFRATWQPVADLGFLARPGDFVTAEVAGEPVVVVRDKSSALRAFYNVCRHRAGAVAEGCGRRQSLQCRYHGWTYGLDGALLHTPEMDGVAGFDRGRSGLVPIGVATFGPVVFVNLDERAAPLDTFMEGVPRATRDLGLEGMVKVARRDYVVGCNWKVYVDNYLEGYHVPIAHPALNKMLDYASYRVKTHRYHSEQFAPLREGQGDQQARYYWVFPNWMLNIYPDNISINIVVPLALDRTLTIFEWYRRDAAVGELENMIAFSDEIQREDISLCEMVQKRIASRAYDGGRFSVEREAGVHHFQCLVHEFLSRA